MAFLLLSLHNLTFSLPAILISFPSFYVSNSFHSTLNFLHGTYIQYTKYFRCNRPPSTINCPFPIGSTSILLQKHAMVAERPRLTPCRTVQEQGCIASKVSSVPVCLDLDTELKSAARLELAPHRVILTGL